MKRCPKLIYTTLTGYGLEGPDADRPGMDQAAFWARSGLAAMFRPKGGDPVMLRTAFGDHVASLAIVAAVMAAVYERQQTGKGRLIDASLLRAAHYAGSSDLAIQHTRGRIASNRPAQEHAQSADQLFPDRRRPLDQLCCSGRARRIGQSSRAL